MSATNRERKTAPFDPLLHLKQRRSKKQNFPDSVNTLLLEWKMKSAFFHVYWSIAPTHCWKQLPEQTDGHSSGPLQLISTIPSDFCPRQKSWILKNRYGLWSVYSDVYMNEPWNYEKPRSSLFKTCIHAKLRWPLLKITGIVEAQTG